MIGSIELVVSGTRLRLLPERAVWLPDEAMLLIADAHIGKAVSFRRLGVPVPQGTTTDTLARLAKVVERTAVQHIVFLGDLLHSARARAPDTWAAVARWREQHATLKLTLVRGNHDQQAGDPPAEWGVHVMSGPLRLDGLALTHHPEALPGAYVLAGHLHPCTWVGGKAHDHLRLPCFHFGAAVGVLPAFGAFTGMHAVRAATGDRIYAIADDEVLALPR